MKTRSCERGFGTGGSNKVRGSVNGLLVVLRGEFERLQVAGFGVNRLLVWLLKKAMQVNIRAPAPSIVIAALEMNEEILMVESMREGDDARCLKSSY